MRNEQALKVVHEGRRARASVIDEDTGMLSRSGVGYGGARLLGGGGMGYTMDRALMCRE